MDILYTTQEIRSAICELFAQGQGKRVAVAAFVGRDADAFLPRAKGIEIYCWPKEGATDPGILRNLKARGANIFFSDSLHMKIYWAEGQGCVVSSANLSKNALGGGHLKEIGVLLDDKTVDMRRIIREIKPHPMKSAELRTLARKHRKLEKQGFPGTKTYLTFEEWMREQDQRLLFGWYTNPSPWIASKTAKRRAKTLYGRGPEDWIYTQKSQATPGDYFICFLYFKNEIKSTYWMFVDEVIPVESRHPYKLEGYPFIAVQYNAPSTYRYPFSIDAKFKKAFKDTMIERGVASVIKNKELTIDRAFLDATLENYKR